MKLYLLIVLMFTCYSSIYSQSGVVYDETGEPQPFCKVTAPDLDISTYCDFEGRYSISVPDGTLLQFEYISYETTYDISRDSLITILKEFNVNLEKPKL